MFLSKTSMKPISIAVITAFSASMLPVVPANAALIGNEAIVEQQSIQDDRAMVQSFMDRADVRAQFESLGVDADEAKDRVAALSDAEVSCLADRIHEMPAGQGALGTIVGAALIIFIVLLITDILGFTDVFSFTNKGAANPS